MIGFNSELSSHASREEAKTRDLPFSAHSPDVPDLRGSRTEYKWVVKMICSRESIWPIFSEEAQSRSCHRPVCWILPAHSTGKYPVVTSLRPHTSKLHPKTIKSRCMADFSRWGWWDRPGQRRETQSRAQPFRCQSEEIATPVRLGGQAIDS